MGHQLDDAIGQLERRRVAKLERRGVIQLQRCFANGLGNLAAAMAQSAAPQAREAIKDTATVSIRVIRALGGGNDARLGLEVAVAGEGHPVGGQPLRIMGRGGCRSLGICKLHGNS